MLMNARSGGAPRAGSYTSARGLHANAYHACPPVTLRLPKGGGAAALGGLESGEEAAAGPFSRKRGGAGREKTTSGGGPANPKRVCFCPPLPYTQVGAAPRAAPN